MIHVSVCCHLPLSQGCVAHCAVVGWIHIAFLIYDLVITPIHLSDTFVLPHA